MTLVNSLVKRLRTRVLEARHGRGQTVLLRSGARVTGARRSRSLATGALLVGLALGCQSASPRGAPCTRSAECGALVCASGRCREGCAETRDCPDGSECIPTAAGGACTLAQERCTSDAECEAPLVCAADARCRAACLEDTDCTSDGHCVLAGRLVCVAATPPPPPSCVGPENFDFGSGLAHWCVETSAGLDASVVRVVAEGSDGHAAALDLGNAPVGAWARLYQEMPLPGGEVFSFDFARQELSGAVALTAIELLDASGVVLGRVALAGVQPGASSTCDETGQPHGTCRTGAVQPNVVMVPSLASGDEYARVDLRAVASIRRVVELARTGEGDALLVLDRIASYGPACPLGWWREGTHLGLDTLDDLQRPASGFTIEGTAIRTFPVAECGIALALDGRQHVEWTGALPDDYTVSLDWHGAFGGGDVEGLTFVRELGTSAPISVSIVAGQILVHGCTGSLGDSARIVPGDSRFQELQLYVSRTEGLLCLARSGHRIDCLDDCLGTSRPTGLRFGEAPGPLGDVLGLDELRIDAGDLTPDPATTSGHCVLDLACHEAGRLELRDVGGNACVAPSACTDVWRCPEAAEATDPSLCGGTGTLPCVVDPSCPLGVRGCTADGCYGLRPDECTQPLATTCG